MKLGADMDAFIAPPLILFLLPLPHALHPWGLALILYDFTTDIHGNYTESS